MRIMICSKGERRNLFLPSGLVLNRLTVGIGVKALEKYTVHMSYAQMVKLVKCIHAYRKAYPDWVLVQVRCADGDEILVKL